MSPPEMDYTDFEVDIKEEFNYDETEYNNMPAVLTKRLEDMSVFHKDVKIVDVKNLLETVESESRPENYGLSANMYFTTEERKERLKKAMLKFFKCMDIYKETSTNYMSNKLNNDMQEMCKPMSIVLHDIRLNPQYFDKINQIKDESEQRCDNISDPLEDYFENMDILQEYITPPIEQAVNVKQKERNAFLFDHAYSGEMYLYSLDIYNNVIEYQTYSKANYKFDSVEFDNIINVYCCCWYRREINIKSILRGPLPSNFKNLCRFMKISHTCSTRDCKCCCKESSPANETTNGNIERDKSKVDLNYFNVKNKSYMNMSVKKQESENLRYYTKICKRKLIARALSYQPKLRTNRTRRCRKINYNNENITVQISSQNLHKDIYKVSRDGQIYFKHSYNSEFGPSNEHVTVQNSDRNNNGLNVSKYKCINKKIINYLKTPLCTIKSSIYCPKLHNSFYEKCAKKTLVLSELLKQNFEPKHTGYSLLKLLHYHKKISELIPCYVIDEDEDSSRKIQTVTDRQISQQLPKINATMNANGKTSLEHIRTISTGIFQIISKVQSQLQNAEYEPKQLGLAPEGEVLLNVNKLSTQQLSGQVKEKDKNTTSESFSHFILSETMEDTENFKKNQEEKQTTSCEWKYLKKQSYMKSFDFFRNEIEKSILPIIKDVFSIKSEETKEIKSMDTPKYLTDSIVKDIEDEIFQTNPNYAVRHKIKTQENEIQDSISEKINQNPLDSLPNTMTDPLDRGFLRHILERKSTPFKILKNMRPLQPSTNINKDEVTFEDFLKSNPQPHLTMKDPKIIKRKRARNDCVTQKFSTRDIIDLNFKTVDVGVQETNPFRQFSFYKRKRTNKDSKPKHSTYKIIDLENLSEVDVSTDVVVVDVAKDMELSGRQSVRVTPKFSTRDFIDIDDTTVDVRVKETNPFRQFSLYKRKPTNKDKEPNQSTYKIIDIKNLPEDDVSTDVVVVEVPKDMELSSLQSVPVNNKDEKNKRAMGINFNIRLIHDYNEESIFGA